MKTADEQKLMAPGKWFAEFDENGNPGATYYDVSFRRLLGYESEEEFANNQESWEEGLHPDDRERAKEYFDDIMGHHPEGKDYDIEYRMMTKWGYRWFHDYAKITRRENGSVVRFEGATFDIQHIKDYEYDKKHEAVRKEVLDYIITHEDEDPLELLKRFAEKIRQLIDCDQVIFRDLEKVRIMVNSPAIENTWAVPLSYCEQCQHLDPFHKMYAGGYTEMENCQEGWQGIPVYEKCPIKSSLTRIVYCNGKVAGYVAFHYVQNYHKFTDTERDTLEEIVRNLSLVLSRYEWNRELAEMRKRELALKQKVIGEQAAFTRFFLNTYVSAYYVNLVTLNWRIYKRTEELERNYPIETNYLDSMKKYIEQDVHPDDRKELMKIAMPERMREILREKTEYAHIFRDISGGKEKVYRMQVIRGADDMHAAFGFEDITVEYSKRARERNEIVKLRKQEHELKHSEFRASALAYFADNQTDITAFLHFFAEKLRELVGCDQVIYKDEHGRRFIHNAPELGHDYEIDEQTCLNCPHSDMHSPLYAKGVTEMENTRIGVDGVPVHKDCPVKSALTRTVRQDGEVCGYLAIHYILDYHRFSDDERQTLDEFTNLLSMSLSRYAGRMRNEQLERELEQKRMAEHEALAKNNQRVMALEDNFESLYEVELESGHYMEYVKGEFYQSNVIEKLVSPGDYFEDLRKNIDAVIYPEDRDALFDVLNRDAIRKALAENERFEHFYRITVEGEPMWFKIRVVYKDKEKKSVIIGVFNAAEEVKIKQQEQRRYEELIATFASKYEAVFVENLHDGTFRIMNAAQDFYLPDEDEPHFGKMLKNFVKEYVHPIDRHLFDKRLFDTETTRAMLKVGEDADFEFRQNRMGEYLWHHVQINRLNDDEVLFGFADCDDEVVAKIVRDKLIDEYDALYVLDLDRDEIRPARASRVTDVGVFKKKIRYKDVALRFADIVEKEYREDWKKFSDVKYMKEYMAKDDHREYVYVLPSTNKKLRRFTVDVLDRIGGEAKTLLLSFMGIDDLHAKTILLNAKLAEQALQLEDALTMAKTASNAKTSFLFNMSHDIRTPINAITGFTLMAKKYVDDKERVKDYLEKIDMSGQQLLMLINQVLEMSRIESGKVEFNFHPVNIKERYEVMVTVLSEQALIRGLNFTHSLYDIQHLNVLADDTRMSQISLNIVGNAIKYTPEGGSVDFSLREIPARKDGYASYVFTVTDTGIGMSEEFLAVMYEPFSRENNSTVSHIQGTGLGMSIVKSLVDLAGGKIEVQSELGKGTRFDITLDFEIDKSSEANRRQSADEERIETDVIDFKGKRVLLVEDNELNREIAKFLLEDLGLDVYEATDGTFAVDEMKTIIEKGTPDYYDIILMDIQMPMMDGYEATRAIRELERSTPALLQKEGVKVSPLRGDTEGSLVGSHHIPIIALSANAFEEDKQKSYDAGMDGHIAKPIDVPELMRTLAKFLK